MSDKIREYETWVDRRDRLIEDLRDAERDAEEVRELFKMMSNKLGHQLSYSTSLFEIIMRLGSGHYKLSDISDFVVRAQTVGHRIYLIQNQLKIYSGESVIEDDIRYFQKLLVEIKHEIRTAKTDSIKIAKEKELDEILYKLENSKDYLATIRFQNPVNKLGDVIAEEAYETRRVTSAHLFNIGQELHEIGRSCGRM